MNKNSHQLKPLATLADWEHYHHIRKSILFEGRGRFGLYDRNHPDDRKENNHPFLFTCNNRPIGAVRVDIHHADQLAFMRLVAIIEQEQRKGHGKAMVRLVEEFALSQGSQRMFVVPTRDAIVFYEKCGYAVFDPKEEPVKMFKKLSA